MDQQTQQAYSGLINSVKRIATLYIDNVRLTAAEKVTILFSAVAMGVIILLLAMAALVFLVLGIATLLESYIAPFWTYLAVCAIFVGLIALLYLLRETLIFNPVARFISRLFIDPPKEKKQ